MAQQFYVNVSSWMIEMESEVKDGRMKLDAEVSQRAAMFIRVCNNLSKKGSTCMYSDVGFCIIMHSSFFYLFQMLCLSFSNDVPSGHVDGIQH